MKHLTILIAYCFFISIHAANKIEFSKNELLYIDQNFKTLKIKKSEEIKKWDIFKQYAIRGNSKSLQTIFEARKLPMDGIYLSTYKYDLFEIFAKNPKFFIEESFTHFNQNVFCSIYWIFPNTGENSISEIKNVIKDNSDKILINFNHYFEQYLKMNDEEKRGKTKNCYGPN